MSPDPCLPQAEAPTAQLWAVKTSVLQFIVCLLYFRPEFGGKACISVHLFWAVQGLSFLSRPSECPDRASCHRLTLERCPLGASLWTPRMQEE